MSNYIPSKDRAKVIRKALAQTFGNENVSVKKGTGTASSWVNAHVKTERPQKCTCEFETKYWNGDIAPKPFRKNPYCEVCKAEHNRVAEIAKKISNEAMTKAGYEHSTFTGDDGYNIEHDEFILQVDVK